MTAPTLLYCIGATKAGTTWLYRYLHDHPECAMPAVKEAHYWDTFDTDRREKQLIAYRARIREMRAAKAEAIAANRGWQVDNMDRRINEMKGLIAALEADRTGDSAYAAWLTEGRSGAKLVADITPNYATLSDEDLARMRDLSPNTKFLYLIRDPLDRLWSHIRMQARRQRQAHEQYEKKANNILYRMLNRGHETHILERGDYPKIIRKLRRVIPEGRLLIQFAEDMFTPEGLARICTFLGIAPAKPAVERTANKGPEVVMLDKLRPRALGLLNEHYEWVARNVGPLPQRWQDNLARG
ncbi:sulfotransferase family protein [Yoonia maricola]|uniref:Sulfotransferase family protein n=1 Tax=Yoonia maricola TaxID=420999 RepID=A0A2M8WMW3_9RHOB|nr:sulfotransferase [Yoonia maricola]PJI92277.1 sulfotransferase family protein [Yoonia maricola]